MKKIILLFAALLPLLSNAQISLVKTFNEELFTFNSFLYYDSPAFLMNYSQNKISILDDQFEVANVITVTKPDSLASRTDMNYYFDVLGVSKNIYTSDGALTVLVMQNYEFPYEVTYEGGSYTEYRRLRVVSLLNLSGQILWQEQCTSSVYHMINNGAFYLILEDIDRDSDTYVTRIYHLPGDGQGTDIREVPMRAQEARKYFDHGHMMISTPSATYNASGARLK